MDNKKFKEDYVLRNKDGKEIARINLGKISQEEMNLIDEAKYAFHNEITSDVIEFSEVKKIHKEKEPEQISLFSVCEIKGIK